MGKGTIISGGSTGLYQVQVNFFRTKIDAEIASLTTRISFLTDRIAVMEDGLERDVVKLQRTGAERRKDFLENNIPADETIAAWCADLTEDLSGSVGTVEVPGERGTVLIQPGYEGNAVYTTARDGQLLSTIGATPEQYFYNLAMMPGWQKWKPTFRFGTITLIDGDTANVTMEGATSSQQSINVNQAESLVDVAVEYMNCDGSAFEVDDEVLIKFENQDWASPKIVGFKDHPKPCLPWLVVKLDYDIYGGNVSFVWDIDKNAFATNIPDGLGGFLTMPTTYQELLYWRSITADVTESRNWVTTAFEPPLDHIYFPERDGDSGSQYVEYEEDSCGGNPVTSYISRDWIFTSVPVFNPWEPNEVDFPRCRLLELTQTQDETDDRYIAVVDDDKGFCFNSKINDSLDFKVNLSEEITERTKDVDIYDKTQECWYQGPPPAFEISIVFTELINEFTFLYEEARIMELETPVGNFQIFSVSEPNSIDYEDAGSCSSIVRGDFDNTLYELDIDYFGTPVNHSETVFCQICILQSTLNSWHSTREGACLPIGIDIDSNIKNLAKAGDIVETDEEEIVTVVGYIGIEEDGIIAGQYDPKTGVLNEELSAAVAQIITDKGDPILAASVRFQM